MWKIGYDLQKIAKPALHVGELLLERFQLIGLRVHLRHQLRSVLAFGLRVPDLLRKLIAPRLQLLRFGLDRFALGLERLERLHFERITAIGKTARDGLEVSAQ